jgi:hypothetical protein
VATGWRELKRVAGSASARRRPARADLPEAAGGAWSFLPGCGLLPGEIIETGKSVVVQIELPGVDRDDIEVSVDGSVLRIRGDKQADREYIAERFYLSERAYGRFERPDAAAARSRSRRCEGLVPARRAHRGAAQDGAARPAAVAREQARFGEALARAAEGLERLEHSAVATVGRGRPDIFAAHWPS